MKKFIKRCIISFLYSRVKKLLPPDRQVIIVTGSMGKTTTKTLLTAIFESKFSIASSAGGFNTPIGILLSLLGETKSGFSSPMVWIKILFRVLFRRKKIPKTLILEYGVDRVGDMDELLEILKPNKAIITAVAPVHLGDGHFKNIEEIADEKWKLIQALPNDGVGIINIGNEYLLAETIKHQGENQNTERKILTMGSTGDTDISALDIRTEKNGTSFVYFSKKENERIEIFIPFLGEYISALCIPVIYLARKSGISIEKIQKTLRNFSPPAGRGTVFTGKNNSIIWDSSYNSNPKAVEAMLDTFAKIPAKRKIFLMGTMNELGEETESYHATVGEQAAEVADLIYFVGENFSAFESGVEKKGKSAKYFSTSSKAGDSLRMELEEGDLLLVKGSQGGVFLEAAIEKILACRKDEKFLCRRGDAWDKIRGSL